MQAEKSILDRSQRYQWTPQGRRRRGRPQQSWMNQVTDFMRSINLEGDMAEDIFGIWEWMDDSCQYRS